MLVTVLLTAAALLLTHAPAQAEGESTREAKSDFFIRPSSGLDIKPDTNKKKANSVISSTQMHLSDKVDIGPMFGKPRIEDMSNKKRSGDWRAGLGFTFHF